jgi:hypothetical protein
VVYRKALVVRRQLADDSPANTRFQNAVADCYNSSGRTSEAVPALVKITARGPSRDGDVATEMGPVLYTETRR